MTEEQVNFRLAQPGLLFTSRPPGYVYRPRPPVKADIIRELLDIRPRAKIQELIDAVKARGLDVTPTYVRKVKEDYRKKKRRWRDYERRHPFSW